MRFGAGSYWSTSGSEPQESTRTKLGTAAAVPNFVPSRRFRAYAARSRRLRAICGRVGRQETVAMSRQSLALRCCPGLPLRFAWAPSLPPPTRPRKGCLSLRKDVRNLSLLWVLLRSQTYRKRFLTSFLTESPGTNLRRNPGQHRATRALLGKHSDSLLPAHS